MPKQLYGRGLVIDTYDQPKVLEDRPTTVAIFRIEEGLAISDLAIERFITAWEKRSKFHRVTGGKFTKANALELSLVYAGTKGRDEDMGQIRARFRTAILPFSILPPKLTYSLHYYLDDERPSA